MMVGISRDDDFDSYFRQIFPKAVVAARRITHDEEAAKDAAVEALARAYSRWHRVSGLAWRDAWVLRVTINEALRRIPRATDAQPVPDSPDLNALVDLRQALVQALSLLPNRQREAVTLRYLADLSEAEVAKALGISRGAVKTHLHRGIAALREGRMLLVAEGGAGAHVA